MFEAALNDQVATIRRFSRFYTRQIGLLDEGLLRSAFSLTQARILYELAHREGLTAGDLGRGLGLDAGYLSRILKQFEAHGLIGRAPSPTDGRQRVLALTEAGRSAFAPLDQASHDESVAMLSRLRPGERGALVDAMTAVERLLGPASAREAPVDLRPLRPGDIGWITHRQGVLYAEEYGWDTTFEGLVAEIAGGFVKTFDPARERCWIADREGDVLGSVFLVRHSDAVAKLRLLYVEPGARGLGLGRRLVEACVGFAREAGYTSLILWTNDVLVAARHIYDKAGFRLTETEAHHSFGKELIGETWVLDL